MTRNLTTSFRYPPDPMIDKSSPTPSDVQVQLKCACGKVCLAVGVTSESNTGHCHCKQCRRFHVAAFASFCVVPKVDLAEQTTIVRHPGACATAGQVDRLWCACCFSVLGMEAAKPGRLCELYLALGTVEDASIPHSLAQNWRESFTEWTPEECATWPAALPMMPRAGSMGPQRAQMPVSGGCACNGCRFTANVFPGELQHCYCKLCRKLSGAAFQTWTPCLAEGFAWTNQESLILVRTTPHGQRHMCRICSCTLTIVYDSQPDTVWPAAGCFDDETIPLDISNQLYRVIHICCIWMQSWYTLPDDKLPRLKYAG